MKLIINIVSTILLAVIFVGCAGKSNSTVYPEVPDYLLKSSTLPSLIPKDQFLLLSLDKQVVYLTKDIIALTRLIEEDNVKDELLKKWLNGIRNPG